MRQRRGSTALTRSNWTGLRLSMRSWPRLRFAALTRSAVFRRWQFRAPNFTLQDLREHSRPRTSAVRIGRDVRDLRSDVVEFENDDVPLGAVDARVILEIRHDPRANLRPARADLKDQTRLLSHVVGPIVRCIRLSEAGPAPRLAPRLAASDRRELVARPRDAAPRTGLHAPTNPDPACRWNRTVVLLHTFQNTTP